MKELLLGMKQTLFKRLKQLNVAIVSHIFATGPALDLEEYLKDKTGSLLFIGHPFVYRKEISSFYRYYQGGQLKREHKAYPWKLPEGLLYLKDAFFTLWWVLRQKKKIDFYIGSDNFSAFFGLVLKRLGKAENVILYTVDYLPKRFSNPIFNSLYHFFDKQCLIHCRVVWNVSARIAKAREDFKVLKEEEYKPQIVVPLGMWYDRIPKVSVENKDKYTVVFMGHILEKQGLDVAINALPVIAKRIPQVKLIIIGTGPYEEELKLLAKRMKIDKRIEFLGYIEKHEDVEKRLAQSTVAIAPYKPDPESFTYFADPGKIKNYLAAGLPVVLTDVPAIAKEIETKEAGIICDYKPAAFAHSIITLLADGKKLRKFSKNATRYAGSFDWNIVFHKALKASLD